MNDDVIPLNEIGKIETVKVYNQAYVDKQQKRIAEQEELLNSTLEENKDIYKKMADLDTALEDCTESLTDARIKIKELEKENTTLKERNAKLKGMYAHSAREAGTYKQFLELKEKENANLEEKISILLSCKNCPDNKGGLLCQKEYEDKCLAQKIQYIKELKEENAELEAKYLQATDEGTSWAHLKSLEQENEELKAKIGLSIDCEKAQKNGELCLGYGGDEDEPCERCKNCIKCEGGYYQLGETEKDDKLTKAKDLLIGFVSKMKHCVYTPYEKDLVERTEQFLKEN